MRTAIITLLVLVASLGVGFSANAGSLFEDCVFFDAGFWGTDEGETEVISTGTHPGKLEIHNLGPGKVKVGLYHPVTGWRYKNLSEGESWRKIVRAGTQVVVQDLSDRNQWGALGTFTLPPPLR